MGSPVQKFGVRSVSFTSPEKQRFIVSMKDARGTFSLFVESFTPNQSQPQLRQTRDLWEAQRFNQNTAHAVALKVSTFGNTTRVERISPNGMIREVA